MPYTILDIDISKPLSALSISDGDSGIAIILRHEGRPIDFLMESLPSNPEPKIKQLEQRIREKAEMKLSQNRIKEEQMPQTEHVYLPSLTIAICTKDRPNYLARCLHSLMEMIPHSHSIPSRLEILVVDNAPSDNQSLDLISSFYGIRYACEPLKGLNFARNRALKEATGHLLVFIDDDVVVDRGWLSGLMRAWSRNPTAAAFTGLVLPYELVTEAQIIFEKRGGFRRGFNDYCFTNTLPGNALFPATPYIVGTGANMAFQRDILLKLGGFDEALDAGPSLPGGGDLDIFYRLIRSGHSLEYEPAFLVFHQHRREMKDLCAQYWSWGKSFMIFVNKSYMTDPTDRFNLSRVVVWWFSKQLWNFLKSLLGRHFLTPKMVFAETWGGLTGLMGGYGRSIKNSKRIRSQLVSSAGKNP